MKMRCPIKPRLRVDEQSANKEQSPSLSSEIVSFSCPMSFSPGSAPAGTRMSANHYMRRLNPVSRSVHHRISTA